MDKDYGLKFNLAFTVNGKTKEYNLGGHLSDSEGLDVDTQVCGTDTDELIQAFCRSLLVKTLQQRNELEKKAQEEAAKKKAAAIAAEKKRYENLEGLHEELSRMSAENERLQKRIAEIKKDKIVHGKKSSSFPGLTPETLSNFLTNSKDVDKTLNILYNMYYK